MFQNKSVKPFGWSNIFIAINKIVVGLKLDENVVVYL